MQRRIGLVLLQVTAWSSIVLPVLIDGVVYRTAHMDDPLWLPHAKLHCAMSFHAAIALGAAALILMWMRRGRQTRSDFALIAFLGSGFWIALVTAGLWPGTSFTFANDPAFVDMQPWVILGVTVVPNVALAVLLIAMAAAGFLLAGRTRPTSVRR